MMPYPTFHQAFPSQKITSVIPLFIKVALIFLTAGTAYAQANGDDAIRFVENKGQWDKSIIFAADFTGGKLLLHDHGMSYVLENSFNGHFHERNEETNLRTVDRYETTTVEVSFVNAKPNPVIITGNATDTQYNFYLNNNKDQWASGCKAYNSVTYQEIYEGIDLKLYSENHSLKYDLILKKGADPNKIRFSYEGQKAMRMEGGCVFASTALGTITENRPVAYQFSDKTDQRKTVPCKFVVDDKTVGFSFPEGYQKDQKLIIDPELIFSTFSGATSDNFGYTACYDSEGNLYSGGIIFGPDLAAGEINGSFKGRYDMAILKYDSSGSDLLYSTFIGGTYAEAPHSLIVNNSSELVILGTTGSDDFPVSAHAFDTTFNGGNNFTIFDEFPQGSDIVLTKLNTRGRLLTSTYIGGPGNDGVLKMNAVGDYVNRLIQNYGDYQRGDLIVDEKDNVYVASTSDSTGFPVASSIQNTYNGGHSDAVVFSLNTELSQMRWGTYLGGTGDDAAYSIKLNDKDQLLIGGGTLSGDFPTTPESLHPKRHGDIDGFITKIDPEQDAIIQSTYLGTGAYDQIYMIDLDKDMNVYAIGQTRGLYPVSSNDLFSVPNSGQFIHKLTPDLDATIFSTVFGSGSLEPNISPTAFLASECDKLFLSGWGGAVNNSASMNSGTTVGLPVTSDAMFPQTDGSDFYLMVLSSDGRELLYATYFGGNSWLNGDHVDGGTSRFDKSGIVYQSVCSCGGSNDDFPTTPGAWSQVNRGVNANGTERCNNAAFKFDLASLNSTFETDPPEGCSPLTVSFTNTSTGGEEYLWTFGDGTSSQESLNVKHRYEEPGTYTVTLLIKDNSTCIGEDISTQTVTVYDINTSVSGSVEICEGESTQLTATGGNSYEWNPTTGLDNPTSANPMATPAATTTYEVEISTTHGCSEKKDVTVTVVPKISEDFEVYRNNSCSGAVSFSFSNQTPVDEGFIWNFGDGTTSTEPNPTHTYQRDGQYMVSLELASGLKCVVEKEVLIEYLDFFVPNVFTPNNDRKNDFFVVESDLKLNLKVFDREGTEVFSSENYQNDWDGKGLPAGVYYYRLGLPGETTCSGWVQLLR